MITITTNHGDIAVELLEQEAPVSSQNFLSYARDGFYDGTVFHRVIDGFMIQGGGFTQDMQQKKNNGPIANESKNGVQNAKYTLAMARTADPHSATSQFFINVNDNRFLDQDQAQDGHGYAVFARVTSGTEVVDKIAKVETGTVSGMGDVPIEQVVIEKVVVA